MEIILYQASARKTAPLFNLARKAFIRLPKRLVLRGAGSLLIGFAVISFLTTAIPLLSQEIKYRLRQLNPIAQEKAPLKISRHDQVVKENQKRQQVVEEAAAFGVPTDFSIVIPKISAASPIIANVDPSNENEYRNTLKRGVAHAAGTKLPGNGGAVYLFAHSASTGYDIARYNAVFYLLKELKSDDEIIIFFAGQKYRYRVSETMITRAEETDWLTKPRQEEILVLQTCWPPGTSLKRLLVIAKPVLT